VRLFSFTLKPMKLIKCIFRAEKLNEVVAKLESAVRGMTVSEVRGHGHQRGHPLVYRGLEYETPLLPKIMVEIAVDDNRVDDTIKIIIETARTGAIGDGRIFVHSIEANYHIRTGFMEID
jgi:nitrogen regulatory protein PII